MAIQYGYVTMFAAAAPWAAALCVLNNVAERRLDVLRLLYQHQRPQYEGAEDIGAWGSVFEVLSFAAIVTNVAILAVTSRSLEAIYGMSPDAKVTLCVVLEHVLVLLKIVVAANVDSTPKWVRKAHACRAWLAENAGKPGAPSKASMAAAMQKAFDDEAAEDGQFRI